MTWNTVPIPGCLFISEKMAKYRDISMAERIDKLGQLLAKGVYLYIQKQKEVEKDNADYDEKMESEQCHKSIPNERSSYETR